MSIESVGAVSNLNVASNVGGVKANSQAAGKISLDNKNESDTFELSKNENKSEVSNTKKGLITIASLFLPGAGQLLNGEPLKAAGFFAGSIASSLIAFKIKKPIAMLLLPIANAVASGVDAYKNVK